MISSRDETPADLTSGTGALSSGKAADTGRPRVHGSDAERKAAYRKREQERHAATEADLETLLKAARRLCRAHDLPAQGMPDVIASLDRLATEVHGPADVRQA